MPLVDQVPGRVVDIQENGIETGSGFCRVESPVCSEGKEVPLDQAAEAYSYIQTGRARGKVAIQVR